MDVEKLIIGWLTTRFPAATSLAETPGDPEFRESLPIIEVTRIGGADTVYRLDTATVDVECYGVNRQAASTLASQVRRAMREDLPAYRSSEGTVLQVETLSAPAWRPYDNTNVRRFGGTYRVTVHELT